MDDRKILLEMFNNSALVPLQCDNGTRCKVRLTEPDVPDLSIEIRNIPADAVVIKVDLFPPPKNLFQDNKGECKRADYAIISLEKKCILYIEMKKNKTTNPSSHIVAQLKGAECVMQYCQAIGQSFWETPSFLQGYKNRFCCIFMTKTPIPKKTSRDRPPIHDSPNKFAKFQNQNYLQFNKLADNLQ